VVGTVLLVVALLAIVMLRRGDAGGDGAPVAADRVRTSAASGSTSDRTNNSSAEPNDAASYYTTDGTRPAVSPECNGVFSICLGAPIETAIDLLGREEERFEGVKLGSVVRAWTVAGCRVSIEADHVGSITSITAALVEANDTFRLALPDRLLLGDITMGDVVATRGAPHGTDQMTAENDYYYSYIYQGGPEGTERLEFTHINAGVPVGSDQALRSMKVTTFTVRY
jgi:hypothetical protein